MPGEDAENHAHPAVKRTTDLASAPRCPPIRADCSSIFGAPLRADAPSLLAAVRCGNRRVAHEESDSARPAWRFPKSCSSNHATPFVDSAGGSIMSVVAGG